MVPGLLGEHDLAPVRGAMIEKVDQIAEQLVAGAVISDPLRDEPFETRLAKLFASLDAEHFVAITGQSWRDRVPGYFDLLSNSKILDVVESLIGPEIFANPVYNVRPKVPLVAAGEVPWHQDKSYWPGARSNPVITVWVALVDATIENGCLRVIPRTQHQGVGGFHFETYSGTAYRELDEENVGHLRGRAQPLPVNAARPFFSTTGSSTPPGPTCPRMSAGAWTCGTSRPTRTPCPNTASASWPGAGPTPAGWRPWRIGKPSARRPESSRSGSVTELRLRPRLRATRRASRNGTGARAASVEAARTISAAVAASVRRPTCATTGLVPRRVRIQRATSSPASTSGAVAPRARMVVCLRHRADGASRQRSGFLRRRPAEAPGRPAEGGHVRWRPRGAGRAGAPAHRPLGREAAPHASASSPGT